MIKVIRDVKGRKLDKNVSKARQVQKPNSVSRFFIKVGKKEHIVDLQQKGTIFMNTVGYFINYEERQLRGDKDEGITGIFQGKKLELFKNEAPLGYSNSFSLKIRDGEKRGNIYSLIAITTQDDPETFKIDGKNKEFGDSFILIYDVQEFIRRIEEELKAKNYEYRYGLVQYYDPKEYSGELDVFCKQNCFKYQNEFRFFVKKAEDGPLIIKIGSIEDISRVFSTENLDKAKLNVSKYGEK